MPLRKTKPSLEDEATSPEVDWRALRLAPDAAPSILTDKLRQDHSQQSRRALKPSQNDVLQVLLLFAALHDQFKKRTAPGTLDTESDARPCPAPFEGGERFDLDEVLKLIAERAVALTGAGGVAIALGEKNEIVLRAAAGAVRPGMGACIDTDSVFYRACLSMAQVVTCDDTETDARVNLQMCRNLGARSMVAVPLRGRRRVIGLLGAFSAWPFGFNDRDVSNLGHLAELVLGALKPEEEERFAESAQIAATKLEQVPATDPVANVPQEVGGFTQATPAADEVSIRDKTELTCTPAMASPDQPELKPVVAPAFDERLDAAMPPRRKSDSRTYRSGTLFLLVSIFIGAALAGGVWRTSRMGQLSSGKMHREKLRTQVDNSEHPGAASAFPDKVANPNSGVDSTPHPPSNAHGLETLPAGQELSKSSRITGIRHWSSGDSSTVVFELEEPVEYEVHRLNHPERIYFDLHNTNLAADLVGKVIKVGDVLLHRIRIAQPAVGITRIVLETKIRSGFSVRLESNPCQLVVELRNGEEKSTGAMNTIPQATAVEKNDLTMAIPAPIQDNSKLQTPARRIRIVVDAGHGGLDVGTYGRGGLIEKNLVLEIAQRLGKLLETGLSSEVILTRNADIYVPLEERAKIANQAEADLFISVHANYSGAPSARGVETYYTDIFFTADSNEFDPGTSNSRANSAERASPSFVYLQQRAEHSRRLAASVQRSLYFMLQGRNPGLRDRGIKEANFAVLAGSAMPAILVEVSFVSSPADEQNLRNDGYREQIAAAVYQGIVEYLAATSSGEKIADAGKIRQE